MVRVRKLRGGILNLMNHTTQISEANTMIKTLNKLIRLSRPNTKEIV
ncbi:hypothetical protein [Candidatus Enterovibrio altilux]|nr:hypothetical protein [Candidatus Enterovibrio luxaltus]